MNIYSSTDNLNMLSLLVGITIGLNALALLSGILTNEKNEDEMEFEGVSFEGYNYHEKKQQKDR